MNQGSSIFQYKSQMSILELDLSGFGHLFKKVKFLRVVTSGMSSITRDSFESIRSGEYAVLRLRVMNTVFVIEMWHN